MISAIGKAVGDTKPDLRRSIPPLSQNSMPNHTHKINNPQEKQATAEQLSEVKPLKQECDHLNKL
jgi:hypothetical protein